MDNFSSTFADTIKNKTVLVTGGTGSFGRYIVRELLNYEPQKIIVFSRDEDKQHSMEVEYKAGHVALAPGDQFRTEGEHYALRVNWEHDLLNFALGDVRDLDRVLEVTRGVDVIFHAAALKQVPSTEFRPFEAVKTNIIGAHNVKVAAIRNNVEKVIAISTDKAVKPVNAMGMTKAIQEKILLSEEETHYNVKFACVRYGNIVGSRGSVVPFFKDLIKRRKPLSITSKEMTRFLLTLKEAIELIFCATIYMQDQEIFVRKSLACNILDLAKTMANHLAGDDNYPIQEVGIRPGEKIHEVLVSEEEMHRAREEKDYFVIYPHNFYVQKYTRQETEWFTKLHSRAEYTSFNAERLDTAGILKVLKQSGWV